MNQEQLNAAVKDLIDRVSYLETQFKLSEFKKKGPLYAVDPYLKDYFQNEIIDNFLGMETRLAYLTYCESRELMGYNRELVTSLRTFNKMVKEKFPQLRIKQMTRNYRSMYVWYNGSERSEDIENICDNEF